MSLLLETEMKVTIVKWYYENVKNIVRTQRMVLAVKTGPGAVFLATEPFSSHFITRFLIICPHGAVYTKIVLKVLCVLTILLTFS